MERKTTQRGFSYFEFRDDYNAECSLQESSSVDPHIWLGMDVDAHGNKVGPTVDGKRMGARMHLSQAQVIDLLPLLQFFAKHGHLPSDNEQIAKDTTIINYDADGGAHIVLRATESQAWDWAMSLLRQIREEDVPYLTFMASMATLQSSPPTPTPESEGDDD